jgi:hypothetical protein
MHFLALSDPIGILLLWLFKIAIVGLALVAVIILGGLIGAVMPRLIVKRPSLIEQGIGCVFGGVAGAIIAIGGLLFLLSERFFVLAY